MTDLSAARYPNFFRVSQTIAAAEKIRLSSEMFGAELKKVMRRYGIDSDQVRKVDNILSSMTREQQAATIRGLGFNV